MARVTPLVIGVLAAGLLFGYSFGFHWGCVVGKRHANHDWEVQKKEEREAYLKRISEAREAKRVKTRVSSRPVKKTRPRAS